jgi:hypothetical protein
MEKICKQSVFHIRNRIRTYQSRIEKSAHERRKGEEDIQKYMNMIEKIKLNNKVLEEAEVKHQTCIEKLIHIEEQKSVRRTVISRKQHIRNQMKLNLPLIEKYNRLIEVLNQKQKNYLLDRIEDIDINHESFVSTEPEHIKDKKRYVPYEDDIPEIRRDLCSKVAHIVWATGYSIDFIRILNRSKLVEEDEENCLNIKTSVFKYKGKDYVLFPEVPNILDKLFQKFPIYKNNWNYFSSIFNIDGRICECNEDCTNAGNNIICTKYNTMFEELESRKITQDVYFGDIKEFISL